MRKYLFVAFACVLFFQNCGRVNIAQNIPTSSVDSASTSAGAVVTPTPVPDPYASLNCKEEKHVSIWKDPDQTGVIETKNYLGAIYPYTGALSAVANYNYYSASAHPVSGPVPKENSMAVFFYQEPNGDLYFTTFANVDDGGSALNTWNVNLSTTNNNLLDGVALSDDPGELKITGTVQASSTQNYQGRFVYSKNTDGGVIGPFRGTTFQINTQILDSGDIDNASFFSSDGSSFDLHSTTSTGTNEVSSFIIQYQDYYICPKN